MTTTTTTTTTVDKMLAVLTDAECSRALSLLIREPVELAEDARADLRAALLADADAHPQAALDGARWVCATILDDCPVATSSETPEEAFDRFLFWQARREQAGLGTVDEERDGILSRDRVSCDVCSAVVPKADTSRFVDGARIERVCDRCTCRCCGEYRCDRECGGAR